MGIATKYKRNAVVDSPPDLLGDTILAAAASSVSFVVPTGYDILLLSWHGVYGDSTDAQVNYLTFNSDGGNNYDRSRVGFGGASSTSNAGAFLDIGSFGDTDGIGRISNGFVIIFNRAGQEKILIGTEARYNSLDGSGTQHDSIGSHLEGKWRNTSDEISTITISASAGNYVAGSRFILRGIKSKDGR